MLRSIVGEFDLPTNDDDDDDNDCAVDWEVDFKNLVGPDRCSLRMVSTAVPTPAPLDVLGLLLIPPLSRDMQV